MDEIEAGRAAFLRLLAELDETAEAVIPTAATADNFLIALTRNGQRTMITISEDDLIDLADDEEIAAEIRDQVAAALAKLG